MRSHRQSTCSDSLRGLKREIANITEHKDKKTSESMLVLVSALEVGTDVDRLAEHTGCPIDFIEAIADRMRKASLWIGGQVDDREWSDYEQGVFMHALVAQGILLREPNRNGGCKYLNAETGELEMEWNPAVHQCKLEGKREEAPGRQGSRLDVIKEEVQRIDPELDKDDDEFQTAVVLMAAAFVTGPHTESLAAFTGYPGHLVADISRRMHKSGLWAHGVVKSDHWIDSNNNWTYGFWTDCLVAEGLVLARQTEDGEWVYRLLEKKKLQ